METTTIHIQSPEPTLTTVIIEARLLRPALARLALVFAEVELRPPVYGEMVSDMTHVISSVVSGYVDQSCVELHYEDLTAECWAKTSDLIDKGLIKRCRNRSEFFKLYKTSLLNHVRSLVQKHRFTEKRTGIKPPPKDCRGDAAPPRPREVRIDDPESGFQATDLDVDFRDYAEMRDDIMSHLDLVERSVLEQIINPCPEALLLAWIDSHMGRRPAGPIRVRVRYEHMAKALRMPLAVFEQIHDAIKAKCLSMKNSTEIDERKASAMALLVRFFGVQIPRSTSEIVRKRTLLLAAQHQYERYKDADGEPIREALRICGIPLPEVRNERYRCFGVMFQRHHRICNNCGVREGCELAALNFGLTGDISLSPLLLGAKHERVATIAPTRSAMDSALVESREEEILSFLDETFRRVTYHGEVCFKHREESMAVLFSIGKSQEPFRLRFINPAEELRGSLKMESSRKGGRHSWYLRDDLSTEDALNLIRTHAQMSFVVKQ